MTSVHNSSGLNPQCQMTSVHNSSGLNPQCQMTSVHNSSGLNPQCQMTFEQNGSSLAPQCQQKFIKQLRQWQSAPASDYLKPSAQSSLEPEGSKRFGNGTSTHGESNTFCVRSDPTLWLETLSRRFFDLPDQVYTTAPYSVAAFYSVMSDS
ncbi:hypothetical protein Tco_0608655 [Tanacetum coccineum]